MQSLKHRKCQIQLFALFSTGYYVTILHKRPVVNLSDVSDT